MASTYGTSKSASLPTSTRTYSEPSCDKRHADQFPRVYVSPEGALMLVEPLAKNALSQGGRYSLGAQSGASQLLTILKDAGFQSARVAMKSPFNLILEAHP
jgi:hypothetical protein